MQINVDIIEDSTQTLEFFTHIPDRQRKVPRGAVWLYQTTKNWS